MFETMNSERRRRYPLAFPSFFPILLMSLLVVSIPANAQEYRSGWDIIESGTLEDLYSVESQGNEIWAFGENGIMIISLDGGLTWEVSESLTSSDLTISSSGYGSFLAASSDGTILLKSNNDSEWSDITFDFGDELIHGACLTDVSELVIVGGNGTIWTYKMQEWTNRSVSGWDLLDVSFLDSERGIAVGEHGTILFSGDSGESWDYRDAPTEASSSKITDVEFFSEIRAYAITDDGGVIKSSREINTAVGFLWNMQYFESEGNSANLGENLTSIEIATTNKFLLSGKQGYLSMSKDGGNIVTKQITPLDNSTSFNDITMMDSFNGVAVGSNGSLLLTERSGEDEQIGFEVMDFSEFGNFVDYSKGMLIDGLYATINIVMFGIFLGFFLGVSLSMMKTSPTTLKEISQRRSLTVVRIAGVIFTVIGVSLLRHLVPTIRNLGLDGWEYIYAPIGIINPDGITGDLQFENFLFLILGVSLLLLGILFVSANGEYKKSHFNIVGRDIV